jgi:predicted DNA-binding transcriptional regulator AlpA
MVQGVLGAAELAERLGVSRELVSQWLKRGKLPEPDQRLAMGPVWRETTITTWLAKRYEQDMDQ